MNILLIYPEKESNKRSVLDRLSSYLFKSKSENINLIEISIHLPITWDEKLIDLNVDKLSSKDIIWADHIIVCADKTQSTSTIELLHKCQSKQKKLILCGNAVDANDSAAAMIDHFVMNAAGFEVFSNDLANNSLQKTYQPLLVKPNHLSFQAYSLWGVVGKFTRAIQGYPA